MICSGSRSDYIFELFCMLKKSSLKLKPNLMTITSISGIESRINFQSAFPYITSPNSCRVFRAFLNNFFCDQDFHKALIFLSMRKFAISKSCSSSIFIESFFIITNERGFLQINLPSFLIKAVVHM